MNDRRRHLGDTPPWVHGNTVIASLYDDSGTIMVKRYRLVPPEEPG